MARNTKFGSLTKEPPVERLDATLDLLTPGMTYTYWRELAETPPAHPDAPGLLRKRFLSVDPNEQLEYDGLFALLMAHGPRHPRVRKIMYFIWAMRDERIRRFIVERIADPSGQWDPKRLTNKENWKFFYEPRGSEGSAKKARSNYERYLEKVGIFDPTTGKIDLSLEDGWLTDAMVILAAKEPDIVTRDRMVRDPLSYLISRGLNALANLPTTSRPEHYEGQLENWEPVDDRRLPDADGEGNYDARDWLPRDLMRFQQRSTTRSLNLVALERATEAHHLLERIAAAAIEGAGFRPRQTSTIDMYFDRAGGTAILEMKSCNTGNIHSQVRKGVSQLLEYRWRYRTSLADSVTLGLVLETPPTGVRRWLVEYLTSIGICCVWKDPKTETLITSSEVPPLLSEIVFPTTE